MELLQVPKPALASGLEAGLTGIRLSEWKMVRFNVVNHLAMATGDHGWHYTVWRNLLGMRLVAGISQD